MDDLESVVQPRCPECGTVLRNVAKGYECGGCGLTFLPNIRGPEQPRD